MQCRVKAKNKESVYNVKNIFNQFSADTPDNYIKSMNEHVKDDKIFTKEEVDKLEEVVNGHTYMLRKVLKIEKDWSQEERVKSVLM